MRKFSLPAMSSILTVAHAEPAIIRYDIVISAQMPLHAVRARRDGLHR